MTCTKLEELAEHCKAGWLDRSVKEVLGSVHFSSKVTGRAAKQ